MTTTCSPLGILSINECYISHSCLPSITCIMRRQNQFVLCPTIHIKMPSVSLFYQINRLIVNRFAHKLRVFKLKIGFPDCSHSALAEYQKSQNLRILAFFFTCLQKQRFIGYFPKIIKVKWQGFSVGFLSFVLVRIP